MKKPTLAVPLAVLFVLTACGGADTESAPFEPPSEPATVPQGSTEATTEEQSATSSQPLGQGTIAAMPTGTFELVTASGADIAFELPADLDSEAVADLEQLREGLDLPEAQYVVAEVDNREGTEDITLFSVTAYDTEGNSYEFLTGSQVLTGWTPIWTVDDEYLLPDETPITEAEYDELNDLSSKVYADNLHNVSVAERSQKVLIHEGEEELPDEFARVAVKPYAGLGETEDAAPEGAGGAVAQLPAADEASMDPGVADPAMVEFFMCLGGLEAERPELLEMSQEEVLADQEVIDACQ